MESKMETYSKRGHKKNVSKLCKKTHHKYLRMTLFDFFDCLRFWGENRNSFLQRIKFYGFINYSITSIANFILPFYFKITQKNKNYRLIDKQQEGERIIVSLTSYPVRIPSLWKVIECLFRQTIKPDKIVLYLTEKQVGNIENLPNNLLKLRERGLEIRLCKEEIRSHTKYFQAFQDFPNDIIITIDDDLFYRSDLIENHIRWHKKYPNTIITNWAKEILQTTPLYREWPDVKHPSISTRYLLLGVGSVLYPPNCMYKDVFNVEMIKKLCLTADDIWLSCMALLAKTPISFTAYQYNYLPVTIKNNTTLISINGERNQICVDNLNNWYKKEMGVRPFIDLI